MNDMKHLFTPIKIKGLELKNRIVMPPMCQYSAEDGKAGEWHRLHYGIRAVGGVGLILIEMTNVEPNGRITDGCLGLWSDEQIEPLKEVVDLCHRQGAKVGIQIAHAGRKAEDAPEVVSASDVAFSKDYKNPRALSTEEVREMVESYRRAVARAVKAGVDTVEIHGAHGYLIHQFHSPLTNLREDEYGRDKARFGVEIIRAAREEIPSSMPLIFRISAIEYVEGGYNLDYSLEISKKYKEAGVDVFDITSGGEGEFVGSSGRPGTHAGYQVPFARAYKETLGIPVIAVGKLEDVSMANSVIGNEDADLVAIGRGLLRNPNWALEAGLAIQKQVDIPYQLKRGFPKQVF